MSIPIYKKVQNYILEKIENNEYSEGEQIPTEQELSQLFNASRMTINRAITELSRQNILKRIQGSGTFVMPKKASSQPLTVVDIVGEIENRGNRHRAEIIAQKLLPASGLVAKKLEVPIESTLYFCHIIHFENDLPLAIEKRYIPHQLVPNFFEQDFLKISPSGFLLKNYDLTEMEHSIEATVADETLSRYLKVELGSACLDIKRRTWSSIGLISYAEFIYPASRYRLHSRMRVDEYMRLGIPMDSI
ncbi:histidine utilization repressor [Ignatzschineria indica]|uniref:Histidine utilization repressor n=1 Tax=Ignatzschineria indica TaxID=472583 RepID=A0A2U2ALZ8_9GAMM|nr:UTRA domain-containing protein [Ignatzschineria indica]PWD84167.1 histidine utilization repressor [Ignatzschineria indica]GGZ74408.1 histidine utilization repressor [Ignatzschineria indica]